jgi:hypothetical protein
MSTVKKSPILIDEWFIHQPVRYICSNGPVAPWKSVVKVEHEWHTYIVRRLYLSLDPIQDKLYKIVTTTVTFKNGQSHTRHSIFRGELNDVLQLSTQLTLSDYAKARTVKAA